MWEEDEDKKPFFLKIAIPKVKENWQELLGITTSWVEQEANNTEAWFEFGYANEMLKNYQLALDAYQTSISKDSNNSDALFRSGVIENLQGHNEEAILIHAALEKMNPARADELKELISMQ